MDAILSFDVEEHYRIEAAVDLWLTPQERHEYARRMEATTYWLLERLDEHKQKATFFVVGEIARARPSLIRAMVQAGHEVASHSWSHRRVHRFTPATFREDV